MQPQRVTYGRRGSSKRKTATESEFLQKNKRRRLDGIDTTNDINRTPSPTPTTTAPSSPVQTNFPTSGPSTPSPRRPPVGDLSALFETASSGPPSEPKGKIAKRMLARSRTEYSIISISSGSSGSFEGTKPPKTTSPNPQIPTHRSRSHSPSFNAPGPSVASVVTGPTRTYGGKSRTYLAPASSMPLAFAHSTSTVDAEFDANFDAIMEDTAPPDEEIRESYSSLRERWGVDVSEDDPRAYEDTASSSPPPEDVPQLPKTLSRSGSSRGLNQAPPHRPKAALPSALPSGMMNDLKSITELRSKGESRRFLDEVGYLFEGLEKDSNISLRRASALEIVTKLTDPDFARRAKTTDFLSCAWSVFRGAGSGDGDKVLDIIIAFFAALVARDPRSIADLAKTTDLANVMFALVDTPDPSTHSRTFSRMQESDMLSLFSSRPSDLDMKKAGLQRTEKPVLVRLHNIVQTSGLFPSGSPLSMRLLVSQALVALPPSCIGQDKWPILQRTLARDLALVPIRVKAYVSGMALIPSSPASDVSSILDGPSWLHIENCLSLVDSYLLGNWTSLAKEEEDLPMDPFLLDGLVSLGVAVEIFMRDESDEETLATADKCTEMAFRVLINLSHENAEWCRAILYHSYSMAWILRTLSKSHRHFSNPAADIDTSLDAQFLDRLCLALGLLTNLVQTEQETKNVIRETRIDMECAAKRLCIRGCKCLDRISGIQCLSFIYLQHIHTDDPGADFIRGHVAVLFGLLIRENPLNQTMLLDTLPGESQKAKLDGLIGHGLEFVQFYAGFRTKLAQASEENQDDREQEREASFKAGFGQGEDVARDTMVFLEGLRDS